MRGALGAALALALAQGARAASFAGADVLNIGTDPRTLAQGQASLAASADDAADLPQNPLALIGMEHGALALSHAFLVDGISLNHVAYAQNVGAFGLGASLTLLDYGNLNGTDNAGNPTGTFSPQDSVIQLSGATTWERIELGLSLKRIESTIQTSASAYAFDLAARYPVRDDLKAAIAFRNIGTQMTFEDQAFPLPGSFAVGASWRAIENLSWNFDLNIPFYSPVWLATGAEYRLRATQDFALALRIGVNNYQTGLGGLSGFHAGVGFEWTRLALDYSYDPFGDLGTDHRLSVGYRW